MKCDMCNKKKATVGIKYVHYERLYCCTKCSVLVLRVFEHLEEKDLTITGVDSPPEE